MQTPIYSTPNHTFSTHDLPYESFAREVYAHNGDFLAKVYGRTIEECEANAKAITDGCNAFPALVEALERIQDMFVVPESGFLLEKNQDLRAIGAEMSRVAENALHSLKSEG